MIILRQQNLNHLMIRRKKINPLMKEKRRLTVLPLRMTRSLKKEKVTVYYITDEKQSQYINMFKEAG